MNTNMEPGTGNTERQFAIRRATPDDAVALGRLGALLVRTHYEFDRDRFMAPRENADEGYGRFLRSQLRDPDAAVFVAHQGSDVVGYIYASLEPQNWKELRETAGFIHDVVVTEGGRRGGVATALIEAAIGWLREQGAPRVLLWTAEPNETAQRLFSRLGFRRTMVEMTLELDRT